MTDTVEHASLKNTGAGRHGIAGLAITESRREGAYVYDQQAKRYLDAIGGAGMYNLGRRRKELVEELKRAARETDQGNFPIISQEKAALAEALAAFVPGELECAIFSVGRGEAFDAACKIARGHTGRPGLVALEGGWHGESGFALTLSQRVDKACYGPLMPECRTVPAVDIAAIDAALTKEVAAFFFEPVQAENGCLVLPRDFLRECARLCRKRGILVVADETQTNFGRVGARFAFEVMDIEPDMVILGEALGGGIFPIAATMLTPRVNSFLNAHPLIHLSTFGGSDVGCRVAAKALSLYETEQPWLNASAMGIRLRETVDAAAMARVKEVRGRGLLQAIELEDEGAALEYCRRLAAEGVLALPGAVARNTVILRPALTLDAADIDMLAAAVVAAGAA